MKYMPHDEIIGQLYGAMQTFRKMGFTSDHLYIAFGIIAAEGEFAGRKCVGVQLKYRGKMFNYNVAPVKNDRKFGAKWQRFAEAANAGPDDDPKLKKMVDDSFCAQNVVTLAFHLAAKGITPPLGSN